MLKWRTSIYAQRRAPLRPTYYRPTLLTLVRKERALVEREAALMEITTDMLVTGLGVGMVHVPTSIYRKTD